MYVIFKPEHNILIVSRLAPVVHGNFWATFWGPNNLEKFLPYCPIFVQNMAYCSSTRKVNSFIENFNVCKFLNVYQHLRTFLIPAAILIWYCKMARRQMKHVCCSFRHKSILKFRSYLQATHHSYVSRFFLDECLQLLWITNVKIKINVWIKYQEI